MVNYSVFTARKIKHGATVYAVLNMTSPNAHSWLRMVELFYDARVVVEQLRYIAAHQPVVVQRSTELAPHLDLDDLMAYLRWQPEDHQWSRYQPNRGLIVGMSFYGLKIVSPGVAQPAWIS